MRRLDRFLALFDRWMPMRGIRPLARIESLKLKLIIVLGVAVVVTGGTVTAGRALNIGPLWAMAAGASLAVILVQILARGITAPLREMTVASAAVAAGEYGRQVSVTSVDEVGRLAVAFNEMSEGLADLERQRSDLIANVSHELRTPLAVLHAGLENLLDGVVDDRQTMETMLHQTQRLSRLVAELLTLSRLEAGATALDVRTIDLVDVINGVVAEAGLRRPPPAIDVESPSELTITGDPQQLHSVFANLVSNAIHHGAGAPIEIALSRDGDAAVVEVSDTGPGVPAADLDRLFDRFYRAGNARSGGSGLGLAIASWIVELHRGRIEAGNRQPSGLVVTVRLPARL